MVKHGTVIQRPQICGVNGLLLCPSQPLSAAFEMVIVGLLTNNGLSPLLVNFTMERRGTV